MGAREQDGQAPPARHPCPAWCRGSAVSSATSRSPSRHCDRRAVTREAVLDRAAAPLKSRAPSPPWTRWGFEYRSAHRGWPSRRNSPKSLLIKTIREAQGGRKGCKTSLTVEKTHVQLVMSKKNVHET